MILRRWWFAIVLLVIPICRSTAQDAPAAAALERAIAAYRDLDLDAAASRLAALTNDSAAALLPIDLRLRGLMYLGAVEVLRDRPLAADAAFRRIVALDPAYRPDALVFPPEVTSRFAASRRGVHAVIATLSDSVELGGDREALELHLESTTPHEVRALVLDRTGTPVRLLHQGIVVDTLSVRWTGRDASGRFQPSGEYRIIVESFGPEARDVVERTVTVPLRLERIEPDTLPWPLAPVFTPRAESAPGARTFRPLVAGLLGAAAVVALPSMVAEDAGGASSRYLVAATIVAGGIAGLVRSARPRPIPDNIAWNAARHAEHEQELARVRSLNEASRRAMRLRILAGPARVESGR